LTPAYEDLDIPIALRKDTRKCTTKPQYHLPNYLSFKHFSPIDEAFLISLNTTIIPTSIYEALSDKKWKQTMDLESGYSSKWKKLVECKWVYTIKYKVVGSTERYKARLIVKGFTQTYVVDYLEAFAPIAKINTVRVILSLAAKYGWNLQQFDIKNVFLHGELEEEIYIELPPKIQWENCCQSICKLKKILYGLKQPPRAWFERFTKVMIGLGFKESQGNHTLFIKHIESRAVTLLLVYQAE